MSNFFKTIEEFQKDVSAINFKNCINYYQQPYTLTIFDALNLFEGIFCTKSVKIKYQLFQKNITITIQSKIEDAVLSFAALNAKSLYEELGSDHILNLKCCVNFKPVELKNYDVVILLKHIDSFQKNDILTIIITQTLLHTEQYIRVRGLSIYLCKYEYDYYMEELRRQELVEKKIIKDVKMSLTHTYK